MKQLKHSLLIGCVTVIMAGCTSAPSRFYTLNATAQRASAPDATYGVIVGPVFMPASVDRPQFVVTTSANRVELEEFNRWAAPLGESIERVVSLNLGELLGTSRVVSAPMPDFGPAYHVTIRFQRFESVLGEGKSDGAAMVDALWAVSNPAGMNLLSGHFTTTEPAPGGSFEALAAAHSRALEKLSVEIAAAIQSVAK
jgi:uncharacterized protein